jgi:hypothetical protein
MLMENVPTDEDRMPSSHAPLQSTTQTSPLVQESSKSSSRCATKTVFGVARPTPMLSTNVPLWLVPICVAIFLLTVLIGALLTLRDQRFDSESRQYHTLNLLGVALAQALATDSPTNADAIAARIANILTRSHLTHPPKVNVSDAEGRILASFEPNSEAPMPKHVRDVVDVDEPIRPIIGSSAGLQWTNKDSTVVHWVQPLSQPYGFLVLTQTKVHLQEASRWLEWRYAMLLGGALIVAMGMAGAYLLQAGQARAADTMCERAGRALRTLEYRY